MTDRGRLDYKLATKDEFSKDLITFKRMLSEVRSEFKKLKADTAAAARDQNSFRAAVARSRAKTDAAAARSQASLDRATERNRAGIFQAGVKNRAAIARADTKATQQAQIAATKAQVTAARAVTREEARVAAAQARAAASADRLAASSRRAANAQRTQKKEARGLTGAIQNLFFTFRRLVGVLALFTVAREVAAGFAAMIKESVRFNSVLEQNELGIAALLASVADVRDRFGETVSAAERLNLAQAESRRQLRLLQGEAQKTAASYEDLITAFQVGLAPGLEAGLDVDQVRKLAVQISQAASALVVPQNQLSEEIRSLLTGNISQKNTRIATALLITPQDIKLAKEAGNLAEFLQKRFEAFNAAGEKATKTFAGLSTNAVDAFRRLLAEANLDLFNEAKALLTDILNAVQEVDAQGFLQIRPEVVQALKAVGDGLAQIVAEARAAGRELSFEDLQPSIEALGALLAGAGETIVGVVQGLFQAFALIQAIGRLFVSLGQFLKPVSDFFTGGEGINVSLRQTIANATTLLGVIAAIEIAVIAGQAALARWPAIIAAVGLVAIVKGMEQILNLATGTNTEFSTLPVFVAAFLAGSLKLIAVLSSVGDQISKLGVLWTRSGAKFERDVLIPARQLAAVLKTAAGDQEGILDFSKASTDLFEVNKRIEDANKALKDIDLPFERRIADIDRRFAAALNSGKGISEVLRSFKGLLGLANNEAEKTNKELAKGEGFLSRNVKRLSEQQKIVDSLNKGLIEANRAFESARVVSVFGQSALAARAVTIELDAQRKQQELLKPFLIERLKLQTELAKSEENLTSAITQNAITDQLMLKRQRFDESVAAGQINATRQKLAGIEADILTVVGQIARARDTSLVAQVIKETVAIREKLFLSQREQDLLLLANQARREGNIVLADQLTKEAGIAALEQKRILALEKNATKIREVIALLERLRLKRIEATENPTGLTDGGEDPFRVGDQEIVVEEGLNVLVKERAALEKGITGEIEKQRDLKVGDAKTTEDFVNGLRNSADAYKATLDVLKSTVDSFASATSAVIVDSLDPTTDTDLLARFASFLKQIAQMIIQTFIQVAISKAILGVATSAAGGGGVSGALDGLLNRAEGGPVPHGRFRASARHMSNQAQHFAKGGSPAGVPASDTVPAWLTPGEWVMRLSAVGRYGHQVMDALNRGLLDPSALQAMVRGTTPMRVRRPSHAGYAEGGSVSQVNAGPPQGQATAQVVRAVFVPNETTMEQQIAAGRRPLLALLREEVPQIVAEARGSGLI